MLFFVVISFSSFRRFRFQRISKNRRRADNADETDESKPNRRMIKTRMMGVMLMASSIIDKRSLRRECRKERPAMDLRRQTRRKRSTLSLERLDLSSCYFLKHFEIDISQEREISECVCVGEDDPGRRAGVLGWIPTATSATDLQAPSPVLSSLIPQRL